MALSDTSNTGIGDKQMMETKNRLEEGQRNIEKMVEEIIKQKKNFQEFQVQQEIEHSIINQNNDINSSSNINSSRYYFGHLNQLNKIQEKLQKQGENYGDNLDGLQKKSRQQSLSKREWNMMALNEQNKQMEEQILETLRNTEIVVKKRESLQDMQNQKENNNISKNQKQDSLDLLQQNLQNFGGFQQENKIKQDLKKMLELCLNHLKYFKEQSEMAFMELEEQNQNLQDKLNQVNSDQNQVENKQSEDFFTQNENLKTQLQKFQSQNFDLKQVQFENEGRIKILESDLKIEKDRNTHSRSEIVANTQRSRFEDLSEIEYLKNQLQAIEEDKGIDIRLYNEEKQGYIQILEKCEQDIARYQELLQKQQERIIYIEEENKQEIEKEHQLCRELKSEINNQRNEIENKENQVNTLKQMLEQKGIEVQNYQNLLNEKNQQIFNLNQEIQSLLQKKEEEKQQQSQKNSQNNFQLSHNQLEELGFNMKEYYNQNKSDSLFQFIRSKVLCLYFRFVEKIIFKIL
ncbi:hypothetical protein PPERSA_10128 [Pseudocohnilembus persalinus]|uniref:Uncharacterized protein n=1 Tax=Pseudocohnilembus persalinus TaxID=266149 RepID=A0A0V0QZZ3_PSEPJ|nr:hypothetical protein PPERSA_10128 [Pseudocohnilembus persalinus]|eukprot:KRX07844.1 hypothetical protein PPERSA_10128 [Pseudocohnilembus persalinus]